MFDDLLWDTSLYDFLWIFLIYAILGWCAEVISHAVTLGKFVNRGFLNGSYCPIYGFGMVLVVICLTPIEDNIVLLFLGSIVLTTVLELITGFILEKLFHTRWWDYSNQKLNISGYICLKYSLLWGAACVFVMKIIQPLIISFIGIIPQLVGQILILIFILGMIADLITVIISLTSMNKRMKNAERIRTAIQDSSDKFGGKIAGDVLELQDKLDEIQEKLDYLSKKKGFIQKRLENAYPPLAKLGDITSKEEIEKLTKRLNQIRKANR